MAKKRKRPDPLDRIERNPKVMLGKPVIRGTRVTVELILDKLAADVPIEGILQDYPHLERADVLATLAYARSLLPSKHSALPAGIRRLDLGSWPTRASSDRSSACSGQPDTTSGPSTRTSRGLRLGVLHRVLLGRRAHALDDRAGRAAREHLREHDLAAVALDPFAADHALVAPVLALDEDVGRHRLDDLERRVLGEGGDRVDHLERGEHRHAVGDGVDGAPLALQAAHGSV